MMRTPILCYHSHRVAGNSYETNDHVALYKDLRTVQALGFRVVPLRWVAECLAGQREESALYRSVGISFDDGADADYYDVDHPELGHQRSFLNILRDFQEEFGSLAQPHLHATSFVIASPVVREELDARCLRAVGLEGMSEEWWGEAQKSGLVDIGNHSWDHNHPSATQVLQAGQVKGSFTVIETYPECQGEVEQAAQYISGRIAPAWPDLFAYPWGESSDYIRSKYFPCFAERHRTVAAFGAQGGYVTSSSSRWNVPRFVHGAPEGKGWISERELEHLLLGAR